jgi:plasmid stability protein
MHDGFSRPKFEEVPARVRGVPQAVNQPASPRQNLDSNDSNASIAVMATLTIRNLPDEVYDRLRTRAAENKRSMEAEARELMAKALPPKVPIEETLRRMREMIERLPPEAQEQLSVDSFLADRRKMWGEDE